MTRWWAVAGLGGVVLLALLSLSRISQRTISGGSAPQGNHPPVGPERSLPPGETARRPGAEPRTDPDLARPEWTPTLGPGRAPDRRLASVSPDDPASGGQVTISTWVLLANVALTQGLFLVVLAGGLLLFEVPADALGLATPVVEALSVGVGLGLALYLANELGAGLADRAGLGHGEHLRALLAPDSPTGWAVLLVVVLPVIAGFEELLFRGVLVGALATGFPVSPWLLAAGSSLAFGLGHGAQGRVGVVVTGVMGFVLATAYIVTGSLLAVVVAHYLVNALEFVVHEGLAWEWVRQS